MHIKAIFLAVFYILFLWEAKRAYFEPETYRESSPLLAKCFPLTYSDGVLKFIACCALIVSIVSIWVFLVYGIRG